MSRHDLDRLEEKLEDTGRHQIAAIQAATNPVIIVQRLIVTGVRFAAKHVAERWIGHILVALGAAAAAKMLHEMHWVRWW